MALFGRSFRERSMPRYLSSPVVCSIVIAMLSCGDNRIRRTDPMDAMVDGMFIGPNPDGIFPLFQRHDAIVKSDNLDIRVSPYARDKSVFFVLEVKNSGRASIWLQTSAFIFWIAPDYFASRIRVDKAKDGDGRGYTEGGLAEKTEEIAPESQRGFFITAHWKDLGIPTKRTNAELRMMFMRNNGEPLPIVVKFLLGPSQYSSYKSK